MSQRFNKTALNIYVASVYLGGAYGMYKGTGNWIKWIYSRKEKKIKYKLFEPIVNISYDTSKLVWDILIPGFASAGVVATFPISVPLLLTFTGESEAETETKKSSVSA